MLHKNATGEDVFVRACLFHTKQQRHFPLQVTVINEILHKDVFVIFILHSHGSTHQIHLLPLTQYNNL